MVDLLPNYFFYKKKLINSYIIQILYPSIDNGWLENLKINSNIIHMDLAY